MMTIVTPENVPHTNPQHPVLFLAGSIEQGTAPQWQLDATRHFQTRFQNEPLTVVNPRRENWDASMEQKFENREFNWQVSFELDHLEKADAVVMWLQPGTLSPISLFEFGLLAGWTSMGGLNKLVIGCPDGFWRKGNVEVVTNRYRLQLVSTMDDLFEEGENILRRNHARRMDMNTNRMIR